MTRVALATCAELPDGFGDEPELLEALRERGIEASYEIWDEEGIDWLSFDLVVIRSTWDYTRRREEFLAWADRVGTRLRNPSPLVRWNSDKAYVGDLGEAGLPVVPTEYVGPRDSDPQLEGELVVKPTVSAGARDTGRFGPEAHGEARALLARLREQGRTAMVQPYLPAVDQKGETALVFVAGEPSHALHKKPVLDRDEVAPVRAGGIGAAEAMYRDDLVGPGEASEAQERLGRAVIDHLRERFGAAPLYVRVDMVEDGDGRPVVLEVEAVEPALYFSHAPGSAERLAEAIAGLVA